MNWTLETRPLKDLKPNKHNPRKMSKNDAEHLKKSIEKFGQCEPIVINQNNDIIGGHQRAKTMEKLGFETAEVYVPNELLDQQEANELNIRLNKNHGDFDYDILANVWDPADLLEWGFTLEELHLEDLGSEEEPGEPQESKACKMTITFKSPEHLQMAENRIAVIVDEFEGATYKVKV